MLPFQNYTQDVKMNSQAKQSGKNKKAVSERNLSDSQNADLGKVTHFGQGADNQEETEDQDGGENGDQH